MADSSRTLADWLTYGGGIALAIGAWVDIRKQRIAGSLPTETKTSVDTRLAHLEERANEFDEYRKKSFQFYAAVTLAMTRAGVEMPPTPDGFPG